MISISFKRHLGTVLQKSSMWRAQAVNFHVFTALIIVGSFTFIVKLAGMAKELIVAHQFGTGDNLDAFLIAFLLPSFMITVIAGSFHAALIPTYIQVREQEGLVAAQRLVSSVMIMEIVLLTAISVFLCLSASYILPILGSGFSSEKLALTRSLFFVLLPSLLISGLATIWEAILNAEERFALAAIAPILTPVVIVFVLVIRGQSWGIYGLAVGTVGGFILMGVLLGWGMNRHGLLILPYWYGMNPGLKQVMKQYIAMIVGAFLMSSTNLVDQSMAAMLDPGSVSALSYGNKVVALLLGIGAMALGRALLPHFSRMIAVDDWTGVRRTFSVYFRLILIVLIPLTLILVYFSESLARLLFERGAFTKENAHIVGRVQAFYFLQLPFYTLGIMFVRLISSLKANYILMWGAVISFILNMLLNYIFMKWLNVSGIALSTSFVYAVSFIYLSIMLTRLLKNSEKLGAIQQCV